MHFNPSQDSYRHEEKYTFINKESEILFSPLYELIDACEIRKFKCSI